MRILKWFLVALVVFIVIAGTGLEFLITLPFILAFGWVRFLLDVGPRLTWNWELIITGVACLAVVVIGFHLSAR